MSLELHSYKIHKRPLKRNYIAVTAEQHRFQMRSDLMKRKRYIQEFSQSKIIGFEDLDGNYVKGVENAVRARSRVEIMQRVKYNRAEFGVRVRWFSV